jgi:hypothetical protein
MWLPMYPAPPVTRIVMPLASLHSHSKDYLKHVLVEGTINVRGAIAISTDMFAHPSENGQLAD